MGQGFIVVLINRRWEGEGEWGKLQQTKFLGGAKSFALSENVIKKPY